MSKPLILYHGHCMDGWCSAWAAYRSLGIDGAEYRAVDHGMPPPQVEDLKDRDVIILDFSYKRDVLTAMLVFCKSLTLLDHHESAWLDLSPLMAGRKHFIKDNLRITFDMEKSGARLAWEFFHGNKPAPWLVDYVESRDLWTFHLPFAMEVCAAIGSYPMEFGVWDNLMLALENDSTDLRKLSGKVRETAADFKRRQAEEVLLPKVSL